MTVFTFSEARQNFASVLEKLTPNAVALQIPIGLEEKFEGMIDLLKMKAIRFEGDFGQIVKEEEIPDDLKEKEQEWREKMLEGSILQRIAC